MARRLPIIALLLSTSFASSIPQQTSLPPSPLRATTISAPNQPQNSTSQTQNLFPLEARSYAWSPLVSLQDSSGICPLFAPINCLSISGPNYCCGLHTYCAYGGPENHIGCCADNAVCTGEPAQPYTTVWVPSATATTWWTASGSTVTGLIGPVQTVTTTTTATQYLTGPGPTICSTMYAKGDNLPTTAAAECGLVLVLNGAPGRNGGGGFGVVAGVAMVNGLAAVLGWVGML
ncbi:hypothetical protein E4T39_06012 [Aureobasidium subglaciale]|nr:hypothetical protein E4T39_06012 [Aureobasidium subglaciale]